MMETFTGRGHAGNTHHVLGCMGFFLKQSRSGSKWNDRVNTAYIGAKACERISSTQTVLCYWSRSKRTMLRMKQVVSREKVSYEIEKKKDLKTQCLMVRNIAYSWTRISHTRCAARRLLIKCANCAASTFSLGWCGEKRLARLLVRAWRKRRVEPRTRKDTPELWMPGDEDTAGCIPFLWNFCFMRMRRDTITAFARWGLQPSKARYRGLWRRESKDFRDGMLHGDCPLPRWTTVSMFVQSDKDGITAQSWAHLYKGSGLVLIIARVSLTYYMDHAWVGHFTARIDCTLSHAFVQIVPI